MSLFSAKSVLKPDTSVTVGLATIGSVYAVYNLGVGSASTAHASPANHPSLESSRKKSGFAAFALVSALYLITKDKNVAVLGYGSIVGMEIVYRHSIMVNPATGKMQHPDDAAYKPAGDLQVVDSQAA